MENDKQSSDRNENFEGTPLEGDERKRDEDCEEQTIFRDEHTKAVVDEHLRNPNHVITEEDIRNIKTDVTPNTVVQDCDDDKPKTGDDDDASEKRKDGTDPSVETPWNILD